VLVSECSILQSTCSITHGIKAGAQVLSWVLEQSLVNFRIKLLEVVHIDQQPRADSRSFLIPKESFKAVDVAISPWGLVRLDEVAKSSLLR
jgi:hypothetical protein